jgi:hypothetical protein
VSFGVSIFLFALGAILAWAVTAEVEGLDLEAMGIILMAVGGLGFFFSLLLFYDVVPSRRRRGPERDIPDEPPPPAGP